MNAKKLTEGALLLAVYVVLMLLTVHVPVIGIVSNFFLALPFIIFTAKNDRKSSLVFLVGAFFLSLIFGSIFAVPLALSYGLTGFAIGEMIKMGKSRVAVFIAGTIVFLFTIVIEYIGTIVLFDMNIMEETTVMLEESVEQSLSMLEAIGQTPDPAMVEQLETSIGMVRDLVPSLFVTASLLLVFFIQLVSLPIANRFGVSVPKWPPLQDLTLPKSLLWYYLIVIIASLFVNVDQGGYWYTAILNLSYILQYFMVFQGVTFLFFIAHEKNVSKAFPIIAVVLMFLIPLLLYLVRILGIIDLGFDLRKKLKEKNG